MPIYKNLRYIINIHEYREYDDFRAPETHPDEFMVPKNIKITFMAALNSTDDIYYVRHQEITCLASRNRQKYRHHVISAGLRYFWTFLAARNCANLIERRTSCDFLRFVLFLVADIRKSHFWAPGITRNTDIM